MVRHLLGAAALLGAVYLVFIPLHRVVPWALQLVVKALPALLLAAAVWRGGRLPRRRRVAAALVFCAVGDALLACPVLGAGAFTGGLAAFLVGHLHFIAAFLPERDRGLSAAATARRVAPYAAVFGGMYGLLYPKLEGVLVGAVAAYALALTSMAASTALRGGAAPDSYASGVVGSSFFLATDGLLSIFHFHVFGPAPYLAPQWAVMATYYAAIAGLARSQMPRDDALQDGAYGRLSPSA